jgi:hypothetical protein
VPGAAQASVVAHLLAASVRSPGDPVPDAPPRPCAPPSALAARGIGAVRMAWGGAAEAAGVASLAAALEAAGSRVREVGMLVVSEEALKALLGDDPPPLPPLAASPDAVAAHAAPRAAVDAALQGGNPVGPAGDTIPIWLEPVEVKSACPFAAARGGASGARFTLAPRPPRDAVPPAVVPQVQLQALAAAAPSVLVVCNAVGGVNVFRVERDDDFLRAMLADVVSPWYRAHVLDGRPVCPGGTHVAGGAVSALAAAAERVAAGATFVAAAPAWAVADPAAAFLE